MKALDLNILRFLQKLRFPLLDLMMTFVTTIGNGGIIWIVISLVLLIQNDKKKKRMAFTIILSLIISSVIGLLILKPIIARPRPFLTANFNDLLIKAPIGYSFPSGHTSSSFAAGTAIYKHNKKFGHLAFILAALIAISRMYHSVHYPTDIIGGVLLGLASGIVSYKITKNIENKKKD